MYHKYTKIRHLGDKETDGLLTEKGKVVVQSKIDGANFMFWQDDNNLLHFGSRNSELSLKESYDRTKAKDHAWKAVPVVQKAFNKNSEKFKKELLYYGESMQTHTLRYNADMPGFVGFDVYSLETEELLDWKIAKQEFENLGLSFINVHIEKEAKDISIDELKKLIVKSPYRDDGDEGIVVKRYDIKNIYGRPLFGKIVVNDFKEKNRQKFVGVKNVHTDDVEIANIYATEARIKKIVYNLHDDGNEIAMPLMKKLFKSVIQDILEEHILEIYEEQKSINFKTLEGLVAKKCQITLKGIMTKRNK